MNQHVEEVLETTLQNLKSIVSDNDIIGTPLVCEGFTIIPISKVSIGFVSGGGEYDSSKKHQPNFPFAGGSGGGCNITPVGFLVISKEVTKFIRVDVENNIEKIVDLAQSIIKK